MLLLAVFVFCIAADYRQHCFCAGVAKDRLDIGQKIIAAVVKGKNDGLLRQGLAAVYIFNKIGCEDKFIAVFFKIPDIFGEDFGREDIIAPLGFIAQDTMVHNYGDEDLLYSDFGREFFFSAKVRS